VTPGEQCDDGDLDNGDGCSSTCQIEAGYICTLGTPDVCEPECGDGIEVGSEECDDDDLDDDDGCDSNCLLEHGYTCVGVVCSNNCGDGLIAYPIEVCDDGTPGGGDGCSVTC